LIEPEQGNEVLAPLMQGVHSHDEISLVAAYVSPANFKQSLCGQVVVRDNSSS
jgi:hypothetical protein